MRACMAFINCGFTFGLTYLCSMASLHILESSIDLFYVITDKDGNIVTTNDLFREYSSHIKPGNILDIAAQDSDRDELLAAIRKAQTKSPDPIRAYAKTKQKISSERFNMWNVYSIVDMLHFIGIQLVDVTSISNHEYERQKMLLEEFRFTLSHELRQPLTSIGGLVKMINEHTWATDQERDGVMKMLEDSVEKLDNVIRLLVKKATRQL
jgi:signal transduction histidine kinase